MLYYDLKGLRGLLQWLSGNNLTISEINRGSGVHRNAIHELIKNPNYHTNSKNITSLFEFAVKYLVENTNNLDESAAKRLVSANFIRYN